MEIRHGDNGADPGVAGLSEREGEQGGFADQIPVVAGGDVPEIMGVAHPCPEADPGLIDFFLKAFAPLLAGIGEAVEEYKKKMRKDCAEACAKVGATLVVDGDSIASPVLSWNITLGKKSALPFSSSSL